VSHGPREHGAARDRDARHEPVIMN
jgi:hypothetical protein